MQGAPKRIARADVLLAFNEASYVTGQTLVVDAGLTITDYSSQLWLVLVGPWKLFSDAGGDC